LMLGAHGLVERARGISRIRRQRHDRDAVAQKATRDVPTSAGRRPSLVWTLNGILLEDRRGVRCHFAKPINSSAFRCEAEPEPSTFAKASPAAVRAARRRRMACERGYVAAHVFRMQIERRNIADVASREGQSSHRARQAP
jgi:hypothetical protein